jgi:precorrin-2/cobalt-factor-2 C20-methyltransferase
VLVGVGLGPGDPELLTLRAVKILKESAKVYVPGKLAAQLIKPYATAQILSFPMTHDREVLRRHWEENARIVASDAKDKLVSFAVVGDPNFFSTFTHLRRIIEAQYPEVKITTVPGVSAITSFADRANTPIDNSFEVSDGSENKTKIVLKAVNPRKIAEKLRDEGYTEFTYLENLFTEKENITTILPERGSYFSMILARKP